MDEENECFLTGYPKPITYDCNKKIIEQMENNVFKIKIGDNQGTGFFCEIPFPTKGGVLPVLITNNHIINEDILYKNDEYINLDIKGEKNVKKINLNNRLKYTNKNHDITIIEIKEEDNINHYLKLDDKIINDILNDSNENKYYLDKTVYIIQYPEGELSVSFGVIEEIFEDKKYDFIHKCSTNKGASGSPILNINNNKVIGIHKKGFKNYNTGAFLNDSIKEFVNKYCIKYLGTNINKIITDENKNKLNLKLKESENSDINFNNQNNQKCLYPINLANSNGGFLNNIQNSEIENNQKINQIDFNSSQYHKNLSKQRYIFPKKGLINTGATCYMNATLQCLLHVSQLSLYFIDEYPKDCSHLMAINKNVQSGGDISRIFYNLVMGVIDDRATINESKLLNPNNNKKNFLANFVFVKNNSYNNGFSPNEFKRTLGLHNPQFRKFEANDSKDFILYLLQTLHEEMNYFGDKKIKLNYLPNQYDMFNTYQYFYTTYNSNNFSKISLLFYGAYIHTTICKKCNLKLYNFQKFEFISFNMYFYNNKEFSIMKGFEDNSKTLLLTGDNKFLCNNCKGLQDAETKCQIFEPPYILLINIDYGENMKYQTSRIKFDEIIDITPFVAANLNKSFKYRIIGVCTHFGYSGRNGHYVAFCRHREEKVWYEFNDSIVSECNEKDIYRGSPDLLLYERII